MKKTFLAASVFALFSFAAPIAHAGAPQWDLVLHASDIVAGPDLPKLHTKRRWNWQFNDQTGVFEIAVRKSAFPAPAPKCRMDYLILTMPLYYPETPKQAPLPNRRAVYDAFLTLAKTGKGGIAVRVETPFYAKQKQGDIELTSCNIYFVLPLPEDAGTVLSH